MNQTLVNEMSAQPAFIYSFEYLSGWNSNRNTGAFFQETNANLKFDHGYHTQKFAPPLILHFILGTVAGKLS